MALGYEIRTHARTPAPNNPPRAIPSKKHEVNEGDGKRMNQPAETIGEDAVAAVEVRNRRCRGCRPKDPERNSQLTKLIPSFHPSVRRFGPGDSLARRTHGGNETKDHMSPSIENSIVTVIILRKN